MATTFLKFVWMFSALLTNLTASSGYSVATSDSNTDNNNNNIKDGNPSEKWWKHMSIYNIYHKSFMDTNGDGIGDLNGILQKLQHFVDLEIDVIWLNPYLESPDVDHGYDISNFTKIQPAFGTMEGVEQLIQESKKLGIKFMMDFVVNHCSSSHSWFQMSMQKIEPYTDYFIWKDAKGFDKNGKPIPPNNWLSVFDNTAWTWVESRKQFYYHAFNPNQPDFNYRNPLVVEEIKNVFRFWLDKGVGGLRIDAPKFLFEDVQLTNESYIHKEDEKKGSLLYEDMMHNFTTDLIESYEILREFRKFIEQEYTAKDGQDRPMVVEVTGSLVESLKKWMDYAHLAFNFNFHTIPFYCNATVWDVVANSWKGVVSTYMMETHDHIRIADYYGEEFIDIMNMISTMLPGNVALYYGQEIGMTAGQIRPDQITDKTRDTYSRDGLRTPMQWDDSLNAGFTRKQKPWLPVNPNYWRINLEREKRANVSHYHVVKSLMKLRKTPICQYGSVITYVLSTWVWAFTRTINGSEIYVVILNIGTETELIDASAISKLPENLKILVSSTNSGYKPGDHVSTKPKVKHSIVLRPKSGLVLTTKVDERDDDDVDGKKSEEIHHSDGFANSPNVFVCFSLIMLTMSHWLVNCL